MQYDRQYISNQPRGQNRKQVQNHGVTQCFPENRITKIQTDIILQSDKRRSRAQPNSVSPKMQQQSAHDTDNQDTKNTAAKKSNSFFVSFFI